MKNLQTIRTILLLLIVVGTIPLLAQTWPKYYGQPTRFDNSYDIAEAYDNGYYILGYYYSQNTLPKTWLIKTDVNGEVLWEKVFTSYYNKSSALDPTHDGGVLICGNNQRTEGEKTNPYVIKLNACGEKEWCVNFAESHEASYPWAQDIKELPSGDIVVLVNEYGYHPINTLHLFNLTASGEVLWRNPYASGYEHPGSINPLGNKVMITSNSQFMITGSIYWEEPWNPGGGFILRPLFTLIDSLGSEQWVLPFGLNDTLYGEAYNVIEINQNEYVATATNWSDEPQISPMFIKFDETPHVLNYSIIEASEIDTLFSEGHFGYIKQIDSTFYLAGTFEIGNTYKSPLTNVILSENLFNNPQVMDKSIYLSHYWPYSFLALGTDKFLNTSNYDANAVSDIALSKVNAQLEMDTLDPGTYTYDSLCTTPGLPQTGFISLSDCGLFVGMGEIPTPQQYNERISHIPITAFPNPVKEDAITLEFENTEHHANMELRCYDSYGRQCHSQKIYKGQQQTRLDVSDWSTGIYIAIIYSNGGVRGKVKFVRE